MGCLEACLPVLFVRDLASEEIQALNRLAENPKIGVSAQIIIHSANGYEIGEIAARFSIGRTTISKWIHLFNKKGIGELQERRFGQGRQRQQRHIARPLTDVEQREIARLNPHERKRLEERIQIITLSNECYSVCEIAKKLRRGEKTVSKWITLFNQDGLTGLRKVEGRRNYRHSGGRLVSVVEAIRRREGLGPNEPVPMELLQRS